MAILNMELIEKYFLWICILLMPVLNILVAGILYMELYVWKIGSGSRKKIQDEPISALQYKREIILSVITIIIYSGIGLLMYIKYKSGSTFLYFNISDYGYVYLILSIPAMVLIHDAYFYWTHRLLHLPFFFKMIHKTHHLSTNPSPWTALSFHPVEAVIQGAIALVIIMIIPVNPVALFIFLVYAVITNILGHSGIKLILYKNFINKWFWWSNTSKLHNDHHRYSTNNYGLYFTFWDSFMKTLIDGKPREKIAKKSKYD